MSTTRIAAVFNEGLEPVMDETPEPPDWESLQFEMGSTAQGVGRGWFIAAAAALVVLVGVGSVVLLGRCGRNAMPSGGQRHNSEPARCGVLNTRVGGCSSRGRRVMSRSWSRPV